jgi:hypothetical protein
MSKTQGHTQDKAGNLGLYLENILLDLTYNTNKNSVQIFFDLKFLAYS